MTKGNGDGRDEQFKSLYQKYYLRMVRYYMRVFHLSQEDAEELTQEAFLRFYDAMAEYRGEAEWAFFEAVARNTAYNRFRAMKTAKRNGRMVDIDDPNFRKEEPPAREEPDYAERQQQALRSKQLHDAIAQLPAGQRQCIQLWLDEFSYEDIARVLRMTVDAVKSRVRDAKRLLRTRVGDHGLPEDES